MRYRTGNRPAMEWRIETFNTVPAIACRAESVLARIIWQQTDTSVFSPLFTEALIYLLAADLAGPLHTGATGMGLSANMMKAYQVALLAAQDADVQQRHEEIRIKPRMQGDYHG